MHHCHVQVQQLQHLLLPLLLELLELHLSLCGCWLLQQLQHPALLQSLLLPPPCCVHLGAEKRSSCHGSTFLETSTACTPPSLPSAAATPNAANAASAAAHPAAAASACHTSETSQA
jgi:hypothetical protein